MVDLVDLLVVVPSLGRPQNVERLIAGMRATIKNRVDLVVGLDAADSMLMNYPLCVELDAKVTAWKRILTTPTTQGLGIEWDIAAGLPPGVVAGINHLAVPRAKNYRYIGFMGDDHLPCTVGWDLAVTESLARQQEGHGVGFCFGRDGYKLRPEGELATSVFMTANVVQTLGYFSPPCLRHMYCDDAWTHLGRATSVEFLPDVLIEHRHYSVGKSGNDETYRLTAPLMDLDGVAFQRYMASDFREDVARLKALQPDQRAAR
jgi:hypothetical protein